MSWENYDDVLGQLRDHGLQLDGLDVDTARPVRCRVEGDRRREKKGWYWLTTHYLQQADGSGEAPFIVGSYGIWSGTDNGKVKVAITKKQATLTEEQRKAIAARHRENAKRAEAIRKADAEKAAVRARKVWAAYRTEGQSPYLERKGIQPHGVRFDPKGEGTIAVPGQDAQGRIHFLQIIRGNPRAGKLEKEYWPKGHIKRGRFYLIGTPGSVILVAEGFATGVALHEATGLCVAVAFDANNLQPVVEELRAAHPASNLLICGDDDYIQKCQACRAPTEVDDPRCRHCGEEHGKTNPGREAARTAALAGAGSWVLPEFPASRNGEKLTDFDDLKRFPDAGASVVRDQVLAAIQAAGWTATPARTPQAAEPEEGGGGRRRACSVLSLEELVERFIPLDDGTGKYVFDGWTNKVVHRDQMVALLPAKARWDDVKSHYRWIERGAYYMDEVGFDPAGTDPAVRLNTWQGWPLQPGEGNCDLMLDLVDHLVSKCENAGVMFDWLLDWLAYPLQNPGAKMSSAVIMHGPQGSGKSTLFQTQAKIYGDYATVLNQRGLEDKFNSDWVDSKLFLVAEEVVTRAEMWHVKNELKELVTGEFVRVNTKHSAAYRQRNHINVVYLSNESQPLPIDPDDRRHAVVWTPGELSEEFYDALHQWLENGGVEAWYGYLMGRDLSHFHAAKRPPMTGAKEELIQLSKPSEDRFIDEWVAGETRFRFGPCLSMDLYSAYMAWARENGVRHPRESNQFLGRVGKLHAWKCGPHWVYDDATYHGEPRKRRMVVPPEHLLAEYGRDHASSNKTKTQWLTDQLVEFQRAQNDVGGYPYD
ncbi:DUF5906 domain-containing protein [Thioalkalivibrio sp. ALJ8]|uniref:DUF5906 domain-containing protein n=1 Tax=Thioalkalivibrio sp. ALJ8 TaxID=1158757 RepID=UPI000374278D|nr:DUF5906 domain-containing protein [Thioalkalivibrio sp. ALJ8]